MEAKSQPNGRDGALFSLVVAIEALGLAKDEVRMKPAEHVSQSAEFSSPESKRVSFQST